MTKKAKILVSVNNKGGVGKSFLVQLLASYMAGVKKLNVLALDFDGQGNLSTRFLNDVKVKTGGKYTPPLHPDFDVNNPDDDWDGYSSSSHIYFDEPGMQIVGYPTPLENLTILPSHARLMFTVETNRDKLNMSEEEVYNVPSEIFTPEAVAEWGYDLVIIDTPPNIGMITKGCIRAATDAIIPFELSHKSIQGFNSMFSEIEEQNASKPKSKATNLIGFVANKASYNKRNTQQNITDKILENEKWGPFLIPHQIRDTVEADRVDTIGEDLMMPYTISKTSNLRVDAEAIGEFVYKKLGF